MPFYDYKCTNCDHAKLDKLAKMDETEIDCPECGSVMKRMIGAPNFKMGKSFYVKPPTKAEKKASDAMMDDYVKRAKGERL